MEPLLGLVVASAISMAVIPLVWRLAPHLGLIDEPNDRKVHTAPVPRVGGFGIVLGAILPLALVLDLDRMLQSYVLGALVLFLFGVWDDRRPLGHGIKFAGQLVAAAIIVFYGGLWIEHPPFFGIEGVHAAFGIVLTFIAIVGMVNAVNTSDGLDGLAGGEALLSLLVIAFLAMITHGTMTVVAATSTIGGIIGFLRFNTHPARVFMGDAGSQFLGFTLAFLAILLTQKTHAALSPAVTLLFLGVPIIDIFSVMIQRVSMGVSPFRAQRNHIHHRLMNLGFDHHETVVIIYVVHALFVGSAILLRYESDWLITSLYFAAIAVMFALLVTAEKSGWRWRSGARTRSMLSEVLESTAQHAVVVRYPYYLVAFAVPLYLIVSAVEVTEVPRDFAVIAGVLGAVLLMDMLLGRKEAIYIVRAIVYTAVVFAAYLTSQHETFRTASVFELGFFALLASGVVLTVRYASDLRFHTSPMDYLILAGVAIALIVGQGQFAMREISLLIVKIVILLYASEIVIDRALSRWNLLNLASLFTLVLLATKGLLPAMIS